MTFDELKAEAKRQGYNLIKIQKYIPLTPCVCGAKRSVKVYCTRFGNVCMCSNCGKSTEEVKSARKARTAWNELMEREA